MAGNTPLSEKQKLVRLGLRSPNDDTSALEETVERLKNKFEDFEQFQEDLEDADLGSFDDFQTFLENNGFTASVANAIRTKFEDKYSSFSDFKTTILDEFESFQDVLNSAGSGSGVRSSRENDDGLPAAGVKIYDESGVGRDGQNIPAGSVEVFGKEVHFSGTDTVRDTREEASGTNDPVEWSNLSVPSTATSGEDIDISADYTHNTPNAGTLTAELIFDGTVVDTKTIQLSGNDSGRVTFTRLAGLGNTGEHTYAVADLSPQTIDVSFPNI